MSAGWAAGRVSGLRQENRLETPLPITFDSNSGELSAEEGGKMAAATIIFRQSFLSLSLSAKTKEINK